MSGDNRNHCLDSLRGLSVGDAFGERIMISRDTAILFRSRTPPDPPWRYTDDTEMALSLVHVLLRKGRVDQDMLALSFAEHFDPTRGYGLAMYGLFDRIRNGESWRVVAGELFGGGGSFGNGSAMRVAPLGAYFADDMEMVVEQARLSAEVTHAHREAAAGAIAVAVAAALATRARITGDSMTAEELMGRVLEHLPQSIVRDGIRVAEMLPGGTATSEAVEILGNGSQVICQDTVPFTVWNAAHHLGSFTDALWATASGGGDVDTTCAIVGGIVSCYTGLDGIPHEWLSATEDIPGWVVETPY